jgi:cysteine synthase B
LDHEIMPTKKVAEGGYDAQSVCKWRQLESALKQLDQKIDTEGTVTHFIAAMGTTGTIIGTSY